MNVDVASTVGFGSSGLSVPAIQTVGVIGAGQMGGGIAHVCALAGLDVTLVDIKADALSKALAIINRNMTRQVSRTLISEDDRDAAMLRIKTD